MMQEKVFRVPGLRFIKIRIALPAIWFWSWDRQILTGKAESASFHVMQDVYYLKRDTATKPDIHRSPDKVYEMQL